MILGLLAAFTCFALFLGSIIVWFSIAPEVHRFGAMARVWLILLITYAPIFFVLQHILPESFVTNAPFDSLTGAIHFLNGMLLFTFMYLSFCALYTSDHGLSLAFMFELEGRAGKRMTLTELKQRFPYEALLRGRLSDLESNKFAFREGKYFQLTRKGQFLAAILGGLKRFLKLEPGG